MKKYIVYLVLIILAYLTSCFIKKILNPDSWEEGYRIAYFTVLLVIFLYITIGTIKKK